jgi:predicted type IV restriction endonuclease
LPSGRLVAVVVALTEPRKSGESARRNIVTETDRIVNGNTRFILGLDPLSGERISKVIGMHLNLRYVARFYHVTSGAG